MQSRVRSHMVLNRTFSRSDGARLNMVVDSGDDCVYVSTVNDGLAITFVLNMEEWDTLVNDSKLMRYAAHKNDTPMDASAQEDAQDDTAFVTLHPASSTD